MIEVKSTGDWSRTLASLARLQKDILSGLNSGGKRGVTALAAATPIDTGETATSWAYRIVKLAKGYRIEWYNTHVVDNVVIAIIVQYGHATGDGSWVEGKDYINPAMAPIFEEIADDIWRQVKA